MRWGVVAGIIWVILLFGVILPLGVNA